MATNDSTAGAEPTDDPTGVRTMRKALKFYADGLSDDGGVAKAALWATESTVPSAALIHQASAAPSDELSFDDALLKKVTDAYAARFGVPPGFTASEIVDEVVRVIAAAPTPGSTLQADECRECDGLGCYSDPNDSANSITCAYCEGTGKDNSK